MKKNIPNYITLSNLFCGCIAIICISNDFLEMGSLFIFLGAFFDFFDGFVARKLNIVSQVGLQLDSLADVVTFGTAPGYVMYKLLKDSLTLYFQNELILIALPMVGFIVTLASAMRLAKFNVDTRQTNNFIGLPTPANAFFIASFPLILLFQDLEIMESIIWSPWVLIVITIFSSWIMNAEIPLLSLKFKNFSFGDNKLRYILLLVSLILLIVFQFLGLALSIIFYVIISIFAFRK